MGIHRRHSITRRSLDGRRCGTAFGHLGVGLVVASAFIVTGCRSGTSTFSSPSWWAFGNSAGNDPEKLAAAPPFDGKSAGGTTTKPSQTATPYPTTTTPNGYSVADATRGPANDPAAVATQPVEQAAVTYGSTPPPSAAVAQAPAAVATTPPGGPQVGPYASLPGQIPTAANAQPLAPPPLAGVVPSAPLSAAPSAAPGGFPATAGYEPAARMAEASALPAAEPAAMSRYSTSTSSRFGGGIEPPPSAAFVPQPVSPPAPASPPANGSPPAPLTPPPPSTQPSAAPARRPDPGYRPGGTSSYRPARAMLADEQSAAPSAVRTAAYEVPVAPTSP